VNSGIPRLRQRRTSARLRAAGGVPLTWTCDGIHLRTRVRRWTAWIQYRVTDDPSRGYRVYGTSHVAVPVERGEAAPRDLSVAIDELLRIARLLGIRWVEPSIWSSSNEDPANLERAAAEAARVGWPHKVDPER